jgi:hypothetical protein
MLSVYFNVNLLLIVMQNILSISARMFDYFDAGIMEGLQHRLVNMTEVRTQGNVTTAAGNTISLHSKV